MWHGALFAVERCFLMTYLAAALRPCVLRHVLGCVVGVGLKRIEKVMSLAHL